MSEVVTVMCYYFRRTEQRSGRLPSRAQGYSSLHANSGRVYTDHSVYGHGKLAKEIETIVKTSDNYDAKFEAWAREGKVHPLPRAEGLPPFTSRKFSSYREFNEWKRERLVQVAIQGGVRWTT